jgi:hypothetical protein
MLARARLVRSLDDPGIKAEIVSLGITNGHFGELALKNLVHFSPWNWDQFSENHKQALALVDSHMKQGQHNKHAIPAEAVARTAFGLHFFTDSFSSGHMRVPRKDLGMKGALAAKLMHDMDNMYGLWVTDGFGQQWRAYGDGFLYGDSAGNVNLNAAQQRLLNDINKKGLSLENIDTNAQANWTRVKAAVGAAFKQLHYQAQRYYHPKQHTPHPPQKGHGRHAHHPPKNVWDVLKDARQGETLMWDDDVAGGPAGPDLPLAKLLETTIDEKLEFMKKYVPQPKPVKQNKDLLDNHPPLFLEGGAVNSAAHAYFLDKGAYMETLHMKRLLVLRWHGVTDKSIEVDASPFYYLAQFTAGAHDEGWVAEDETVLATVLDHLPDA